MDVHWKKDNPRDFMVNIDRHLLKPFGLRMPEDLKTSISQLAAKEQLTLTAAIIEAIKLYINTKESQTSGDDTLPRVWLLENYPESNLADINYFANNCLNYYKKAFDSPPPVVSGNFVYPRGFLKRVHEVAYREN